MRPWPKERSVSFGRMLLSAIQMADCDVRTRCCCRLLLQPGLSCSSVADRKALSDTGEGVWEPTAYPALIAEAERRGACDFDASHSRGARGVAIGPLDREFRHMLVALLLLRRSRHQRSLVIFLPFGK